MENIECKICFKKLKYEYPFGDSLRTHFEMEHPEQFKEIKEAYNKYNELRNYYSMGMINYRN